MAGVEVLVLGTAFAVGIRAVEGTDASEVMVRLTLVPKVQSRNRTTIEELRSAWNPTRKSGQAGGNTCNAGR